MEEQRRSDSALTSVALSQSIVDPLLLVRIAHPGANPMIPNDRSGKAIGLHQPRRSSYRKRRRCAASTQAETLVLPIV